MANKTRITALTGPSVEIFGGIRDVYGWKGIIYYRSESGEPYKYIGDGKTYVNVLGRTGQDSPCTCVSIFDRVNFIYEIKYFSGLMNNYISVVNNMINVTPVLVKNIQFTPKVTIVDIGGTTYNARLDISMTLEGQANI